MNTKLQHKTRAILAAAIAGFTLTLSAANAGITVVSHAKGYTDSTKTKFATTSNGSTLLSYNATGVSKLVVAFGTEAGFNNVSATITGVTFNGVALTQAVQDNTMVTSSYDGGTVAIFYLDNPYQGSATFTFSNTTGGGAPNGGLVSVIGLSGTATGIGNTGHSSSSSPSASSTPSTSITTTANNSLVIAALENSGKNSSAGTPTVVSPLTALDNGYWGSQYGSVAAGDESVSISGTTITPTFNTAAGGNIHVVAAEFIPDITPPNWIATWPSVDTLTPTGFTAHAKINEIGTAYYVVLAGGASAPTSAQVKAGQDASGAAAIKSGSIALAANTENTAAVTGLSPGTTYDVWFVAQDLAVNLQASPTVVSGITTTNPVVPPVWITGWPAVDTITPYGFTARAEINELGTAHFVVLPDGATAPSSVQVKAGTDGVGNPALKSGSLSMAANTENTAAVTGLTPGTTYDVWFVAEDLVPNLQASPTEVIATTQAPDTTPPTPNPMTFAVAPARVNDTTIVMTATTATDALTPPVQYYFENTTTSVNSGWISGTVWTDNTGLLAGQTYGYQVKARDAVFNETAFSDTAYVAPLVTSSGTWKADQAGTWGTTTNWTTSPAGNVPDGAGNSAGLTFNITAARTVTLDTKARTLGILNIGDTDKTNSYTLAATGGATLTFDNSGSNAQLNQVANSAGDTLNNSLPILLNGSLDIANAGTTSLTVAGTITPALAGAMTLSNHGGGAGAVTLSGNLTDGSGTLAIVQNSATSAMVLSGTNAYSGGATVSAGTLQFNSAGAIGGSGRNITAAAGAAVAAGYAIDNAFLNRLADNGNAFTVALGAASGNALDFSSDTGATLPDASLGAVGAFTYSGTLTPNGSTYRLGGGGGTLTVSSSTLTGSGNSLVVTGPGTVVLSGTNNYGGSTTVNSGTLQLASTSAIITPCAVTVNPGGALSAYNVSNAYAGITTYLKGGTVRFGRNTYTDPYVAGGYFLVQANSQFDSYNSGSAATAYNLTHAYGPIDFDSADPNTYPNGYVLDLTDIGVVANYQPSGVISQFSGSIISNNGAVTLTRTASGGDGRGLPTLQFNNTSIRAGKKLTVTAGSGTAANLVGSLGVATLGGAELLANNAVTLFTFVATPTDTSTFDTSGGLWSKSGTTTITATLASSMGSITDGQTVTFSAASSGYVTLTSLTSGTSYPLTLTLANAGDQTTVLAQLAKNPAFSSITAVGANHVSLLFTATAATHYFAWDNVHTTSANWYLGGNLTGITLGTISTPYDTWAAGPFLGTLTDTNPAHDFDGGGLPTGIEWVTGGDPTNPADDASVTPTIDNTDPNYFIFTYRRTDAAKNDANTTIMVEYGSDLSGWTPAVDDGSNIIITTETGGGGTGIDLVHVKIKRTLAPDNKLFARLNVAIAP